MAACVWCRLLSSATNADAMETVRSAMHTAEECTAVTDDLLEELINEDSSAIVDEVVNDVATLNGERRASVMGSRDDAARQPCVGLLSTACSAVWLVSQLSAFALAAERRQYMLEVAGPKSPFNMPDMMVFSAASLAGKTSVPNINDGSLKEQVIDKKQISRESPGRL